MALGLRFRLPLLLVMFGCAIAFSLLGLNDNHGIRTSASLSAADGDHRDQTIADGFKLWLKSRKDLNLYKDYPIYIVAAEGGGIYAAFRAATFLSGIQDLCPRFSHHLFSISSVSGGSVGAAVFAGLTKSIKPKEERLSANSGCTKLDPGTRLKRNSELFFSDVAESILSDDFLSPPLAAFFFPDLMQRFLFFPVQRFDRAAALERSVENSWEHHAASYQAKFPDNWQSQDNPLRQAFSRHWTHDSDTPALFMNTTEVETGRGFVISPFTFDAVGLSSSPLSFGSDSGTGSGATRRMVSTSTAAVLSARFPWLTPPGSFQSKSARRTGGRETTQETRTSLVDGGYFDNSGVVTAMHIIREIEGAIHELKPVPQITINLIILTSEGFGDPQTISGDYMVPIHALLNTRSARATIAIEEAKRTLDNKKSVTLSEAKLNGFGYPLPLGWRLSPITRLLIYGQNGIVASCQAGVADREMAGAECLKARIHRDLSR
jgi:hypothetical protein